MIFNYKFTVVFIFLISAHLYAASGWEKESRIKYISDTYSAITSTEKTGLQNISEAVSRNIKSKCRSSLPSLKIECLIKTMKSHCSKSGGSNCNKIADTAIIAKLAKSYLLSSKEKFSLVNAPGDYAENMKRELEKKYAAIATEYSLEDVSCHPSDQSCIGENLDNFCLNMSASGRLPWQTCVGCVLWFIAVTK